LNGGDLKHETFHAFFQPLLENRGNLLARATLVFLRFGSDTAQWPKQSGGWSPSIGHVLRNLTVLYDWDDPDEQEALTRADGNFPTVRHDSMATRRDHLRHGAGMGI
jgi:hypothetical protein